jgi:5-methylcytosine-specific restriction endonuclease McrA
MAEWRDPRSCAYWRKLRLAVLARDRYRCHWCSRLADTVDHVVALAEGGARYDPANLVAACTTCNSKRGARTWQRVQRAKVAGQPSQQW